MLMISITTGCKTYAIKREIADEYVIRAAGRAGAQVHEGTEVTNAVFTAGKQEGSGYWSISTKTEEGDVREYRTRMLLLCDGSTSYMAQKLGIIPQGSQPEAVSSTAYIANNEWTEADGVMLFNKSVLPGYSALFKHYNGEVYFGTYILPGGKATSRCIAPFENEAMDAHPYVKAALGNNYNWIRKRTVAPIRLGGVDQSYSDQLLIAGDAAGHVDPLTGEGIHTAMIAGKIAALSVREMHSVGNFTRAACLAYQLRCYDAFVQEFSYSAIAAKVIYHCPLALDAVACVGQRRGQAFLDFFGEVMTGVRPKSAFMKPDLVLDIVMEMAKQFFIQYVLRRKPLIPDNIGQKYVDEQAGKKQGKYA
jgi:flavin-dependent dehydrogenase